VTAQLFDLTARLSRGEQAVARIAAQPVRHVTPAFVAALLCLEPDTEDVPAPGRVLQLAR
jgi:hypothetical protein